jgi:hypothetical protein
MMAWMSGGCIGFAPRFCGSSKDSERGGGREPIFVDVFTFSILRSSRRSLCAPVTFSR